MLALLNLGSQPLADHYPDAAELEAGQPAWPLRLLVCRVCRLVQLGEVGAPGEDPPADLVAAPLSATMRAHRAALAQELANEVSAGAAPMFELASHGGNLAAELAAAGVESTIVDPDTGRIERLRAAGFAALELRAGSDGRAERARLLLDLYLIAHVRQPVELLRALRSLAADDARLVIECEYLPPLLKAGRFDSVRHGHFSYFSLLSLEEALRRAGWAAVDASSQPVFGGALRVRAAPIEAGQPASQSLQELRAAEAKAGLGVDAGYLDFAEGAERVRRDLVAFLQKARRDRRSVAGYGAPSRGSTLLNSGGISTDLLAFTVDADERKHGRFMPGSGVPILAPSEIDRRRVDDVLLLAWDLVDEIEPSLARAPGRRLVMPLPVLQVRPLEPQLGQRPASRATSGAAASTSAPSER